ncbi:PLP-dependent cysteine synthase family protein [Streptomyces silvisoli]|uniref:Pyridoxal-phosphate dependent enzyme n=1 Tax=Streptomyces silvisoli TaxID=3034235 RepID=A0ABT5ZVU2_9ACTN|nr:pyridoxal-phosphate dependent enzyme [Streptomyces silvisoli]MDF3293939.1 pyridoxal-phosphate dependent enzyme [Streptomyces silvisoli]
MQEAKQSTIDLSVPAPLATAVDETAALSTYPGLRAFRAKLGGTPLVEVPGPSGGARILAKYEFTNPFGSVKDRTAYSLVCHAVNNWEGSPGTLKLLDASGGNMARALSKLGKLMGVRVRVVVPGSVPSSLLEELHAEDAEVDLGDPDEFLLGIIRKSEEIAEREPDWTLMSQHRNAANIAAHEFVTGREIIGQLDGERPACWVAAVGSGGTLTGVSRALRSRFPDISVIGVTPAELPYGTQLPPNGLHKFAGAGGLGNGLRQPFVDTLVPDLRSAHVSYAEAVAGMSEFLRRTGTRIGASSAANWLTAYEAAKSYAPDDVVVTLFADAGSREDWAKAEHRGH